MSGIRTLAGRVARGGGGAGGARREHFAAAGLAKQKTPERVEVVTELPRTPAGKVQKYMLRRKLVQR